MLVVKLIRRISSRALFNLLALLLLMLARIKCTPVILPETHLTPTESAQAANFTTVKLYRKGLFFTTHEIAV
jgi:hypothetical protein